jgi:hypothetical protein
MKAITTLEVYLPAQAVVAEKSGNLFTIFNHNLHRKRAVGPFLPN